MSSKLGLLLLGFIVLLEVSPPMVTAWGFNGKNLQPAPLIPAFNPVPSIRQADPNQDGQPECLALHSGQALLYSAPCPAATSSSTLWQSPPEWQVLQADFTDLNRDHNSEITLLVQRPFKPWPIDSFLPNGGRIQNFHDAQGQSCHLILIGWKYGKFQEVWAGSALVRPLRSFITADLDGNSNQELVVLEGDYADSPNQPARILSIWEWNGFGFSILDRQDGSFQKMILSASPNGQLYILTES